MKFYINDITQKVVGVNAETSQVHQLYDTAEEPNRLLNSPGYLAHLMDNTQKGGIYPNRKQRARIAELLECLHQIHKELDGTEWSPETCQNVADLLCAYGMPVRDSGNAPEDLGLVCCFCEKNHHHDDCPEDPPEV